jgi:phage tail-like protein
MATHEYWQFAFVGESYTGTESVPSLGRNVPLRVEVSNLPDGTELIADDNNAHTVSGDHLRVYYAIPLLPDPTGYVLTGKLKILRKLKEFPRAHDDSEAEIVLTEDNTSTISTLTRGEYRLKLDQLDDIDSTKADVWYYTIFYEAEDSPTTTTWIYSPLNGHDRGFALKNLSTSTFGDQLFRYFPSGLRVVDKKEGNDTLYKLSQIFGRVIDEVSERLDQFSQKRFLPMEVDAAFIPYIDQLLGWPTNFELGELRRRRETLNAISLWKSKGTNNAFELALQELTGWNVELYKGYDYVVTTATVENTLDPNNAPTGWVEQEDGVWANQVNDIVFNGTPDLSGNPPPFTQGSKDNNFRVMFDSTSWVNTYGVLVYMVAELSDSALPQDLASAKIVRLLDYLAIHYANFEVQQAPA